jgi:D-sorbitol dehydrogenase (acceptor)
MAAGLIGQTLAQAFLDEGADVYIAHENLEKAEDVALQLGPRATTLYLDMNSRDSMSRFIDRLADHGGIDVLVNHAFQIDIGEFLSISDEDLDNGFKGNVRGAALTMIAVARQMTELGKRGTILNRLGQLGSTTKNRGAPFTAVFNAMNAALVSLTQSAAIALAPYGIRVNALAPGPIVMPLWDYLDSDFARLEHRQPGDKRRAVEEAVPMKRFGTATDLIGATLFLASEEASFITGQVLDVDGGFGLI